MDHCVVVALGVDAEGAKHALGLWEGTTENQAVCGALLRDLIGRGLAVERARLFVMDGGKGLCAALTAVFGDRALVQRCRLHKRRNVLDHLPERERIFVGRTLDLHVLKRALEQHEEVTGSTRRSA